MGVYKWQGVDCKVQFGCCQVKANYDKPLYWYNYECLAVGKFESAVVAAILITTKDGDKFCIANHFGIGAHKLKNGGWPNFRHFSLNVEDFTEITNIETWNKRKLDEKLFSEYEKKRQIWFKKNYPEQYQQMQNLRSLINR